MSAPLVAGAGEPASADALQHTDAVWLVSSVRGLTEVRQLDGVAMQASPITMTLRTLAAFPATEPAPGLTR